MAEFIEQDIERPRTFNCLGQDRMTNVMHYLIGRDRNKRTGHPTEKPELLTQRIIEVFSNPGEIVPSSWISAPASLLRVRRHRFRRTW